MMTIGITGTIGAGKGAIVAFLVHNKNFRHFSARAFLLEEVEQRGLPPTRDSLLVVANDFRRTYHPGYIMEKLIEKRNEFEGNAVIESVRTLGEIETLRKSLKHFYMFAIDADPKIRYDRIVNRKLSTDNVTFEKFVEDERNEYNNIEPWKNNLSACIKTSDFVFENNGSLDELYKKVEEVLNKISFSEKNKNIV